MASRKRSYSGVIHVLTLYTLLLVSNALSINRPHDELEHHILKRTPSNTGPGQPPEAPLPARSDPSISNLVNTYEPPKTNLIMPDESRDLYDIFGVRILAIPPYRRVPRPFDTPCECFYYPLTFGTSYSRDRHALIRDPAVHPHKNPDIGYDAIYACTWGRQCEHNWNSDGEVKSVEQYVRHMEDAHGSVWPAMSKISLPDQKKKKAVKKEVRKDVFGRQLPDDEGDDGMGG